MNIFENMLGYERFSYCYTKGCPHLIVMLPERFCSVIVILCLSVHEVLEGISVTVNLYF